MAIQLELKQKQAILRCMYEGKGFSVKDMAKEYGLSVTDMVEVMESLRLQKLSWAPTEEFAVMEIRRHLKEDPTSCLRLLEEAELLFGVSKGTEVYLKAKYQVQNECELPPLEQEETKVEPAPLDIPEEANLFVMGMVTGGAAEKLYREFMAMPSTTLYKGRRVFLTPEGHMFYDGPVDQALPRAIWMRAQSYIAFNVPAEAKVEPAPVYIPNEAKMYLSGVSLEEGKKLYHEFMARPIATRYKGRRVFMRKDRDAIFIGAMDRPLHPSIWSPTAAYVAFNVPEDTQSNKESLDQNVERAASIANHPKDAPLTLEEVRAAIAARLKARPNVVSAQVEATPVQTPEQVRDVIAARRNERPNALSAQVDAFIQRNIVGILDTLDIIESYTVKDLKDLELFKRTDAVINERLAFYGLFKEVRDSGAVWLHWKEA